MCVAPALLTAYMRKKKGAAPLDGIWDVCMCECVCMCVCVYMWNGGAPLDGVFVCGLCVRACILYGNVSVCVCHEYTHAHHTP